MSQDQPTTNGSSSETITNFEDICRIAVTQSLLTETDIAEITQALLRNQTTVTPQTFARQAIQMGKITLFQAKLLLAKDAATLTLGPYLLLDKIGQGGMGSVYKARHKTMERIVALKVLRRKGGLSQDSIKRFQREVLAAAKLIHPNIVTAFDAGEQNGIHYLVMEYVDGGDLKSLLDKQGPLPLAKALQYSMQAARGLQYAHEKQIIHRDIKPANLLIDHSGCVKILDLGLARIVREQSAETDHSLTADGALMGTVDFLSPEQSLDTKTADVRSDVYSLGCTLYTLLTGEAVFPGGTLVQKILAHRETPPPDIRSRRKDAPEALEVLLRKMLAKNPADRPQSMAIIADTLQSILAGTPNTDPDTKLTPSTTSEDAFLETIIVGNADTVEKDTPQTLVQTLPQPLSGSVKPKLTVPQISAQRPKTKKAKPNYWLVGTVAGLALVILGGLIGLTFLGSEPKSLTLNFNPNQLRDIAGASITIDQQPYGTIDNNSSFRREITTEEGQHTLRIEKQGYEPFSHTFNTDSDVSLDVAVSLRKQTLPPNPTPGPTPITPEPSPKRDTSSSMANNNTPPAPGPLTPPPAPPAPTVSTPEMNATKPNVEPSDSGRPATPENIGPKTLIVGLGTGELPDLNTALQQAQPNDTILIKHRGPLDVSPIDLTGKTPLTIVGDQQSGVDFWPIIRQRVLQSETYNQIKDNGSAPTPLFYGDKIEINFRKVHLAVGGYLREPISSVLRCNSGKVGLEDCTITASTDDATVFAEGTPFPFILHDGSGTKHLDLRFTRTMVRGARLKSLTKISGEGSVSISGDQFIWAGGQGNLIELGQGGSRAKLDLKSSTIYNVASVLDIPAYHLTGSNVDNLFDLSLDSSIISARDKGTSQFVIISGSDNQSIDNNRWQKLIRVSSQKSIIANFDTWLPTTDRLKTFTDFRNLLQIDKAELSDASPRFRVFPAGTELQEVTPEDLEISRNTNAKGGKKTTEVEEGVGALASKLPPALPRIAERYTGNAEDAIKPRGSPTIIEVNQKNGPNKSLEEAMTKAQGEDVIIEITDSETYIPGRNFDAGTQNGVLYSELVSHLTVRAAEGQKPTIVISDSPRVQGGTVPDLMHWDNAPQLFLFSTRCLSMHFEGLKFVTDISRNMHHAIALTTATKIRMTNCHILDNSTASQAFFNGENGYVVTIGYNPSVPSEAWVGGAGIYWVENVIIEHPLPPADTVPEQFVMLPTAFAVLNGGSSNHVIFRNSAIGSNMTTFFTRSVNTWLDFENSTLHGRLVALGSTIRSAKVEDCLIFCAPKPVISNPPGLVDTINIRGGNNAVWMGNSPITAEVRNQGPFRWMPGPLLTKPPVIDRDYELKGRQPTSTMATDGGPVGIRMEKISK